MATLRTISQTGKEAFWKKDKQVQLSSLEDFLFLQFKDLDFHNRDKSVLGSFENFSTEDVVQGGTLLSIVKDDDEERDAGTGNRVRIYYHPQGSDMSDLSNPLVGTDKIFTHYVPVSIYRESYMGSTFPGYNDVTLAKLLYPIYSLGSFERDTVELSVDECVFSVGSKTVTHPANDDLVAGYHIQQADITLTTTIDTITSNTEFELTDEAAGTFTGTADFRNGATYEQNYIVLKNNSEDDNGIQWTDEFLDIDPTHYFWEVVHDAVYDEQVVINDARFTDPDKKFRGDV